MKMSNVRIERGLAEGSVLSPRLYTIFLADLLKKMKDKFPDPDYDKRDNKPQLDNDSAGEQEQHCDDYWLAY